jgi:MFS-type transporter involved in bile tolerance (Atg22 family)
MPRNNKYCLNEQYSSVAVVIVFALYLFFIICVSITVGVILDINPPKPSLLFFFKLIKIVARSYKIFCNI